MAQPAEIKHDKDFINQIEKELDNYKHYLDFINLSNKYDLNIGSINSQKLGTIKLIDKLVQRMPDHLQEFFILRYKEDNTIEKVAEIMNITPRTCYRYRLKLLHKFKILFDKK